MIGVYGIRHTPSNSRYVGGSTDVLKRWSWHKATLKKGLHYCRRLQDYWTSDKSQIEFVVLEECSLEDLLSREQYFLDITPTDLCLNECRNATRHGRVASDKTKNLLKHASEEQWKRQDHQKVNDWLNQNRTPQSRRESSLRVWTEDRRKLARDKTIAQWVLGNGRGRPKGSHHTEETRAKLHAAWVLRKLHNGGINV